MALPWALAILSLLPLVNAQNPACANLTVATSITNATLNRISGKWFYAAAVSRNPMFKEWIQKIQANFFYFYPNLTEDTILLHDYQSMEDRCTFNSSILIMQRENGTLSNFEENKELFAQLLLLKDPGIFTFAFFLNDEQNMGLVFYTNKPEATPEQLEEFREATECVGMLKSEIKYAKGKKNMCELLEKQKELELKKKEEQT